jgi:hypothetical protein
VKVDPFSWSNEILRQPLFGNTSIQNANDLRQGLGATDERCDQELAITKLETYGAMRHVVEKVFNLYIFALFPLVRLPIKELASLIPRDVVGNLVFSDWVY